MAAAKTRAAEGPKHSLWETQLLRRAAEGERKDGTCCVHEAEKELREGVCRDEEGSRVRGRI